MLPLRLVEVAQMFQSTCYYGHLHRATAAWTNLFVLSSDATSKSLCVLGRLPVDRDFFQFAALVLRTVVALTRGHQKNGGWAQPNGGMNGDLGLAVPHER